MSFTDSLRPASQGKRLCNFLVDIIVVQLLSRLLLTVVYLPVLHRFSPESAELVEAGQTQMQFSTEWLLHGYLFHAIIFTLYYTFCEWLLKGRTIGKFITGTRAVRSDGNMPAFKDALLRTLIRMIPVEPLSGFSSLMWHDRWAKTIVIKDFRR